MARLGPNRVTHRRGLSFIELTQGKVAVIDTATYPLIKNFRWHARKDKRTFYAATSIGSPSRIKFMHQFLLEYKAPMQPDHRDRNGLNNRMSNLRVVTKFQNAQNRKHPPNSSGRTGVSLRTDGKWQAEITVENKRIYLGSFVSKQAAIRSRISAEKEYF